MTLKTLSSSLNRTQTHQKKENEKKELKKYNDGKDNFMRL